MIRNGAPVSADESYKANRDKTISYSILRSHQKRISDDGMFHIGFDALVSHDITYVGIIQTARASGMTSFPLPYVLTNCHNSLCAVGGTINEDDHAFGLSAAKKYGGIYVPANLAVIHQYAREKLAACGRMILGSDSHTRYGCYGTLGVGEGGGELAKQLLENTWDINPPEVVLVWVEGKVPHGIGPHDVALALVGATFNDGFVKNRIMEFAGPGIKDLSIDFRIGVDVMTTETSCLSSVWVTDDEVKNYYCNIGRPEAYRKLEPEEGAYYDRLIKVNLDEMESMIALPFHPSNVYCIHELQSDPERILRETEEKCNKQLNGKASLDLRKCIQTDGSVRCSQGIIVGCSGGMYENLSAAADILRGQSVGNGDFSLSVYPSSAPINRAIVQDGVATDLIDAGAVIKPCFCGPCFGAGDTPANNTLSIRHATRNFPNREGSRPGDGQISAVALMDARSIAATAANGGVLTAATDVAYDITPNIYHYTDSIYEKRCYNGFGHPDPSVELVYGPNIADWPKMPALEKDLLVCFCADIRDDVTTTDELIPSGETSSYRSNPIKLSEFALSRRVPEYVSRSKEIRYLEESREDLEYIPELEQIANIMGADLSETSVGSAIFAKRPGDGSAREQAASCQKVLGGFANVCFEYATKRYRSNCINWGIVPFTVDKDSVLPEEGDWLYVPDINEKLLSGDEEFSGLLLKDGGKTEIRLYCSDLSPEERKILTEGCLINYYAAGYGKA
ncbi:MAG: hydratase [Oscillospiraceae bacterium]|nr:hydratase [Oscillospiraceae bacterium]MBR0450546.1 hydratase [Oscillospiraceae bacterium]